MGKSFRGSKSTFHLWEFLVHVFPGSQMDAGVAFKSTGSGMHQRQANACVFGSETDFLALLRQITLYS